MHGQHTLTRASIASRAVLLAQLAAFSVTLCKPASAALLRRGSSITVIDANISFLPPAASPYPAPAPAVIPPVVPQPPPPILPCYDAASCAEMKVVKTQAYCKRVPSAPMCRLLTACPPGGCLNGECKDGYCQCKEGFYGPACQMPGGGKVDLSKAKFLVTAPEVPPPFMPLRETPGTITYERMMNGPGPAPGPMASAWLPPTPAPPAPAAPPGPVPAPVPVPAPAPAPALACAALNGNYDIGGGTFVAMASSGTDVSGTIPGGGAISGSLDSLTPMGDCIGKAFFPGANTPMDFNFEGASGMLRWSNGVSWTKAGPSPAPAPSSLAPAPAGST